MPGLINSDITIIGAGPAGSTAALALGKMGIECLLIDRETFPRKKICGDGLSGKVISILNRLDPAYSAELAASGLATTSRAVRFYSPSLKMMELSFLHNDLSVEPGFVCKRIDFDNFLLNKALTFKSIHFEQATEVKTLSGKDGHVILKNKEGNAIAETRLVLFAAGADRNLVRQLDPSYPGIAEEGIGVRSYFENVTGSDDNHAIEIHFLKELLPWYLWIFPFADGSANVGLALPESLAKKNSQSLKELLHSIIEKYPHLSSRFRDAKPSGKTEAARLPYFTGGCRVAGDNYLLLGDAARIIDPFTGEGIGNAMASGYHAAQVAADCLATNNFTLSSTQHYQQKISDKLMPELALGLKLQGLARHKSLLNLVIGRASRNAKTRDQIAMMLYSTKAKKQLNSPLFYFKLALGL